MISPAFKGVFGTILNVQTAKEWDTLLGTLFGMSGLHFDPIELRICCKIAKLAGLISEARTGQTACCLSSDCLEQLETEHLEMCCATGANGLHESTARH